MVHSATEKEEEGMGRPPCCDKVGIKKGPWTPEEDIILVSYIQEHGPGNWRSVPTNTGLLRCSKSCRLRWTNYLRPGIKRGNFTPREEGIIIHLQALMGNKWAAIASYLPQRTDNDIKNYWNTHLKKKLKKCQSSLDPLPTTQFILKSRSLDSSSSTFRMINPTSSAAAATGTTYASSTENISRLLEGWMRSSPKPGNNNTNGPLRENIDGSIAINSVATTNFIQCHKPKADVNRSGGGGGRGGGELISQEEFESILSFENMNNFAWDKTTTGIKDCASEDHQKENDNDKNNNGENKRQKCENNDNPPLSFLERWLLDESGNCQLEESMELPPIF